MSALTENKNFLSGVLAGKTLDFDKYVFGLWVSVFQNVNHSANGYSYPKPIIQDFTAIDYSVVDKKLSIFNYDGEYSNVRFFITSGLKGFEEFTDIIADITDTFISGYKPLVIMPDMEFAGKIYRKYEVTGLVKSLYDNSQILSVSGEDWVATNISVQANKTDLEYGYSDSQYSGYSNEVTTRYKFLYDDSNNSIEQNISAFEIPTQIENGADIRYRISRKSDPLGSYFTPTITADGKIVIDYSAYKDEVSGYADSLVDYDFEQSAKFVFPQRVFENLEKGQTVTRPINDTSITGIQLSRITDENDVDCFSFKLLTNGAYSDIYKVSFNLDRFSSIVKQDVVGYVLTGIQIEDGSPKTVIDIAVNDGVYPRVVQSTRYNTNDLLNLANTDELIYNEEVAQENAANIDYNDEDKFAVNLRQDIENRQKIINDLLKDEPSFSESAFEGEITRRTIDDKEIGDLNFENDNPIVQKFILPTFPLPKETVDKEYFSNYINSGEEYIASPLVSYNLNTNYVFYGNQYGQLGYYIEETPSRTTRTVVNSTCNGIFINETGLCVGDSATFANMPYVEDLYILNGQAVNIPSNGVISKDNFIDKDIWSSAINYYYNKNYLFSCDIFPTDSVEGRQTALKNALSTALARIGVGVGDFAEAGNGKDKDALIYVEREIYVEDFDQDQVGLFNNVINPIVGVTGDFELQTENQEKLYAVQTFDTDFAASNQMSRFFFNAKDYQESVVFNSFTPYKDKSANQILSYATGENYGTVYSKDVTLDQSQLYRLEYVTGDSFTYNKLSAFSAWNGTNGQSITIANQDEKNYAYHLYEYNNTTDELTFVEENVFNGDTASITKANAVVLKFFKKGFGQKTYIKQVDVNSFRAIDVTIADANGQQIDETKVFFNLQKYDYEAKILTSDDNKSIPWYTNKENPINDDNYGANNVFGLVIPRFFQDSPEESKVIAENLISFPNGPSTSKNYEGSSVDLSNVNSFVDGALNNTLKIKEANSSYVLENDFILNFTNSGKIVKEEGLSNVKNFDLSRRLKITRVKYNFYVKDLILIGDAGFPYSIELNTGWEYKLQYRIKNGNWKEMESVSQLGNKKIEAISSFLNPYFYKLDDLSTPNYLSMVGFVSNISRFLDDGDYEFRIFKYQKLISPSESIDIYRKTNFFPVQVNLTWDNQSQYYNIYQVDFNNNLKLIGTETQNKTTSYVIPSVKQEAFNKGLKTYPVNGVGYYNIIASGALPLTEEASVNVSDVFNGAKIGNEDNGQLQVNVIQNVNSAQGYAPVSNVTYSPLINFNNPEAKIVDFEINSNYSGYYFVSDSKDATLTSAYNDLEFYVANIGASQSDLIDSVASVTTAIPANNVAIVSNYPNKSTTALSSLPSSSADLQNGEILYLTAGANINSSDFSSSTIISFIATIVNDSNSSIQIDYGATNISIAANKTQKLTFNNGWNGSTYSPTITASITYTNVEAQTSFISSRDSLVNLNYELLELDAIDYSNLPVYNFSNDKLSVNGDIDLDGDSFYFVNWNGQSAPLTAATATKKKHFDSIKIFIDGKETEDQSIFVLKDDTDINISNFRPQSTVAQDKIYFFIKDDSVTRALNLKIINGAEEIILPRGSQDFKLTVKKTTSGISYAILYPSNDFSTVITDTREQMIVIKTNGVEIDIGYIESALKSNAFVYFVNKSTSSVLFRKNFTENVFTLPIGQVAKAVLQKGSGRALISQVTNSKNHFGFTINPAVNLADPSNINILNLKFSDTKIKIPSVSSFAGKNTFLLCKNRFAQNIIDQVSIAGSNLIDNDIVGGNSRVLRLFKENVSDKVPTIDRLEVDATNLNILFKEPTSSNSKYTDKDSVVNEFNVFYIKDQDLATFTIADFYARENKRYSGKILTSPKRQLKQLKFFSFDEIYPTRTLSGTSFDFDFDAGDTPDGSLSINSSEKDSRIFDSYTEDNGLKKLSDLKDSHLCANFSYSSILIQTENITLYKNRIASDNLNIYPIYNSSEFFISPSQEQDTVDYRNGFSYFYDIVFATNVTQIILPLPFTTSNKYIFNNLSSKPMVFKVISSDATFYTLNPNSKITVSVNAGAWSANNYNSSSDGSLEEPNQPLQIIFENQNQEIDSTHPFRDLWGAAGYSNQSSFIVSSILAAFLPDSGGVEKANAILNNSISYSIIDASVELELNTNTNNAAAGDPTIFCFGRRGPDVTLQNSDLYVLNDFYLYFLCSATNETKVLTLGKVWGNKFIPFQIDPTDAVYVERKSLDLGSLFQGREGRVDISKLQDATMFPFYKEVSSFYLPNLSTVITSNNQQKSLGELLLNKKFVFVNLVTNNSGAVNQIYNYSNIGSNTDLIALNSVAVFSVVLNSGVYSWQKQTSNIPVVQNCYPVLYDITGVADQNCANITDGNEFIYLPNIDAFEVNLDSFKNKQFQNFYLYNSCSYSIKLIKDGSVQASLAASLGYFNKVYFDGSSFNIINLQYNGSTDFVETELLQIKNATQDTIRDRAIFEFPNPSKDAYLKLNYYDSTQSNKYFTLFKSQLAGTSYTWAEVGLENLKVGDIYNAILDVKDLEDYDSDSRLFIYGSSVRNESNYLFDNYDLTIQNAGQRTSSFFIFNNTIRSLSIYIENVQFSLLPTRMVEIYRTSSGIIFKYCETHQKGKFYLSYRNSNKNYIQRNNTKLFIDVARDVTLSSFAFLDNNQQSSEIKNCLLTLTSTNAEVCYFDKNYFLKEDAFTSAYSSPPDYLNTSRAYELSTIGAFTILDNRQEKLLLKPFYKITSAGHFIFSNNNNFIDITPVSGNTFLVNNTSNNIFVKRSSGNLILYRNTVLVVNSSAYRYLKKAKSRDEFYCVFNPKTIVSTQREISQVLNISQQQQILPINNLDFVEQISYVKLFSKTGQEETVYLNLQDYYYGQDIPSDCPTDMVAYELGVGHETIYKFLFFDPVKNYYTLPGITEGVEYVVDINEGLFYNLSLGENINDADFGSVRYMNKKYVNGQTFIGGKSSWYEVDFPNYVRVYKVVREIPNGFIPSYTPKNEVGIDSVEVVNGESLDSLTKFKELIFSTISDTLSTKYGAPAALCWIPENQNAFWLDPNFNKDIWQVTSVDPSSTVKITQTENSQTKELSFVKCVMKKNNLRSPVSNYHYDFYSALQPKTQMSDTGEVSMGFDYNLTPAQRGSLRRNIKAEYSKEDFIYSDGPFQFSPIGREALLQTSASSPSQIKKSSFEITITVEKLKTKPNISIEDFSFDPTVKLLNENI